MPIRTGKPSPSLAWPPSSGFKLLPRMRTWNDVTLYRVDRETTYKHIDALLTQVVDWDVD